MDSLEKNQPLKEDPSRIPKSSDHSLDRHTSKKSRDKGNQNRKSEKSISSQKSPFKSKYAGDKQFARTPFGHSGLSSKSFSRRHIQDNGTTFYAKPAKLGKIAKELKKQPVDINLAVKKAKSLKCYSPVRGSSDEQHQEEDLLNTTVSSNSSVHLSPLEKSNSRSPDNPPRHRKCYTNSKHAEFAKTLKLLDKGQTREIKVSQSVGNLKRNSSSGDEMKYASADDIHAHMEKDDTPASNMDLYSKRNTNAYKPITRNENITFNNPFNSAIPNLNPLSPGRNEFLMPISSPDLTSANFAFNLDCNQSKSNLSYFYRGTDNKMNFEGSDISGVKILLRGDLLGALNCLFPQLNLVPSETNPKRPLLDPNFSYFSDSSNVLIETFAQARKVFNEQRKLATDTEIKFTKEKPDIDNIRNNYSNESFSHNPAERSSDALNIRRNTGSSHLNLRNIVSAKQLHSSSEKDLQTSKLSNGATQQNILKFSQSEPRIAAVSCRSSVTSGSFDDAKGSNIPQDCSGSSHSISEPEKIIPNSEYRRTYPDNSRQIPQNYNKRCLYSSVLKNSLFNDDHFLEEKPLNQADCYDNETMLWPAATTDIQSGLEIAINGNDSNAVQPEPGPEKDVPTNRKSSSELPPPVCYDLDELERDIKQTLEKIVDESDDPVILGQYSVQYPNANNTFPSNVPVSTSYLANQAQKYNENYQRKAVAGNTGLNSLQSRLNFLRTKGRPSDFEQFFNPLAFNTQLAAQFIRQDNIGNPLNTVPIDNPINQLFPKMDLTKLNSSNMPYYQPNPANPFERDIKELLTRYPQIMQNSATSGIHQHNLLATNNANIATSSPFDFTSLYSHLAATKPHLASLPPAVVKTSSADENMVLNQFIASQNLDSIYGNTRLNRYQMAGHKIPNQIPFDFSRQSALGAMHTGMLDQDSFPSPSYLDANHCTSSPTSGIRAIISVSDLEKQAIEQYRHSEESINARYDVLEKEAEEQYN